MGQLNQSNQFLPLSPLILLKVKSQLKLNELIYFTSFNESFQSEGIRAYHKLPVVNFLYLMLHFYTLWKATKETIGLTIPTCSISNKPKQTIEVKWKKKKRDPTLGMKFCSLSPFSQKMERWIDVFIKSVGTDGARTRSFRLDRAVLWPIELQSQEN